MRMIPLKRRKYLGKLILINENLMHDINLIRNNPNQFVAEMKRRFVKIDINEILNLDKNKRK